MSLRAAVGATSVAEGIFYFSHGDNWTYTALFPALFLAGGGALLLLGFFTPIGSLSVVIAAVGNLATWFSPPVGNLFDGKLGFSQLIVTAVAIALLGPGAFSIDAHLFGRREILIPSSSRPPKP